METGLFQKILALGYGWEIRVDGKEIASINLDIKSNTIDLKTMTTTIQEIISDEEEGIRYQKIEED